MNVLDDNLGFESVRAWLSSHCAISYPDHKVPLLRQRLVRVTRSFDLPDMTALAHGVVTAPREDIQLAVMHAASTNHTYFFREPDVLKKFSDTILPERMSNSTVRIWSAACSTGDEAYSIAILAAEKFGQTVLNKLQILGTDISAPVVERAEHGIFPRNQFAHTDPAILHRYFTPTGIDQYAVNASIRKTCTFRRMNLKATPYPFTHRFDVVFCRNILYYFNRADQTSTLEALYDATLPGGWLITSVTEVISDLGTRWQQIDTGIYRRPE